MSTRSVIMIKVRKCDIGKVVKFSKDNLPCGVTLSEWDGEECGPELSEPILLNKNYIGIYCHNDGYSIGGILKDSFKTYDEVLNLISGGSCSYIERDIRNENHFNMFHYANRKLKIYPISWDNIVPRQGAMMQDVYSVIDSEYVHFFDEKNGWKMYKYGGKRTTSNGVVVSGLKLVEDK